MFLKTVQHHFFLHIFFLCVLGFQEEPSGFSSSIFKLRRESSDSVQFKLIRAFEKRDSVACESEHLTRRIPLSGAEHTSYTKPPKKASSA